MTQTPSKLRLEFVAAHNQSMLGGLPALEALAQQFGLWEKLRQIPGLDPRTRRSHGYSTELIVAQLLYCFCTGGASLADAEWLRKQTDSTIAALWPLIGQFIQWVVARAPAERWTYGGRADVMVWSIPGRWPIGLPGRREQRLARNVATQPVPVAGTGK